MPRKKDPLKLLEEAVAKGDLEQAKKLVATVRKAAKQPSKRQPKKEVQPNRWKDDLTLHPELIKESRRRKVKPTPRDRPHAVFVKATCKGCGKKESVESSILIGRKIMGETPTYLCNSCSCGPRGA